MTADELRERFFRCVQDFIDDSLGPPWMTEHPNDPYRTSLPVAQRLAQHIRNLSGDDPRLAALAGIYTARGWGAERFPSADLRSWLVNLGGSSASGIPNDPEEFVTAWLHAERYSVGRIGG